MTEYKAVTLLAPGSLELQMRPVPTPGPSEVLVRVSMAGVCGTDLALYRGQYEVPLPCVMGHEFVGVVEQIGPGVDEAWSGKRVSVEINLCESFARSLGRTCDACGAAEPNHCEKRTVLGILSAEGAFAEYLVAPASNLHALPDAIDDRMAVLVEPMAAAIQTFVLCPVEPDQHVVVLGAGRLGVLIVAAAKAAGARVIAVARTPKRLTLAEAFGADDTLVAGPDLPQRIRDLCGGQLADVVVEVTGNPAGLQSAISLVRPRGTVCLKTTVGEPSTVDLTRIVVDEIQLSASRCGPFADAIAFLEQNKLPLNDWIRSSYPLEKLSDAMEEAKLPGKVLVKVDSKESESFSS